MKDNYILIGVPEVSGVVDVSGAHADPMHPIDALLGLDPGNWRAKVMLGRCGAAETPD
jgi:hypothetical protein